MLAWSGGSMAVAGRRMQMVLRWWQEHGSLDRRSPPYRPLCCTCTAGVHQRRPACALSLHAARQSSAAGAPSGGPRRCVSGSGGGFACGRPACAPGGGTAGAQPGSASTAASARPHPRLLPGASLVARPPSLPIRLLACPCSYVWLNEYSSQFLPILGLLALRLVVGAGACGRVPGSRPAVAAWAAAAGLFGLPAAWA